MEKSKDKVIPSLEESIEILKELKLFHSSYYGNAIDVLLTTLGENKVLTNVDVCETKEE